MTLSTQKFKEKAKLIHGNKYDYSLVEYIKSHSKIKIKCNECKLIFEQKPNDHLSGQGCKECKKISIGNKLRKTKEKFIEEAKLVHGEKYDYSLVEYKRNKIKIKIKCNKCKLIFKQFPSNHLSGQGCLECSGKKKLTTEKFIEKANEVHGNLYDYSLVEYKNTKTKIKIKCLKHGIFEQTPDNHLSGNDCPKCINKSISKIEIQFLDFMGIPQNCRQENVYIHDQPYKVDGYVEFYELKIILEFLGDFWHGNLEKFNSNDINPKTKCTYGELYQKTMDRIKLFEENGYKVIYIWESAFKKLLKQQKENKS